MSRTHRKSVDLDAIIDHLETILMDVDLAVELGVVFGSRASNHADASSDTDVLLVSAEFAGVPGHRQPAPILERWKHDRYGAIDVLCYTPAEFHEFRDRDERTLPDRALTEGIVFIGDAAEGDERREGTPSTNREV